MVGYWWQHPQRWQIVGLRVSECKILDRLIITKDALCWKNWHRFGKSAHAVAQYRYVIARHVLTMFPPLVHIEITGRTMGDFTVGFLGAGMMASAVMVSTSVECGSLVICSNSLSAYLSFAAICHNRMV